MITSEQIRAARALLNWSAADLARRAGIANRTVQRLESGSGIPKMHVATMLKIRDVFEQAGVIFIDPNKDGGPGVRLRPLPC